MAKVELVKQEERKPEWVPFVTLTLSKREAAQVLRDVDHHCGSVSVYNCLQNLLMHEMAGIEYYSCYKENDSVIQEQLDKKFGPV